MSKIYTRTSREPYLVTKIIAENILNDFSDDKIPPQTTMRIKHLEGVKVITKADIRSIDIVYNDRDYWDRKAEIDPRPQNLPRVEILTVEQEEKANEARIKARENLIRTGIIKDDKQGNKKD